MKLLLLITLALTPFFYGCPKKKDTAVIKVGVIAGREAELVETAAKIAQEKFGLQTEIITFSDYVTPNMALADDAIDINIFQHRPYLEAILHDRGYPLVSVGNGFLYPLAAYSQKIKHLAELKQGALIALPNDPTNLGRALLLLQKQGLIELKKEASAAPTVMDITNNPKNLKFLELEAPQLPRALQDVDLAIINTTYASQVNLFPLRDGLFVEEKESPYVNIIVARQENARDKKVQELVQAYESEEVFKKANELFQGNVLKGW